MVAAHCYDVIHEDEAFLITTCSSCNTNGRKSRRYFVCQRSAYKEYLNKAKWDYGHTETRTPHYRRYTPPLSSVMKQMSL